MITPLDSTLLLEQSLQSLSRSGQERFALLSALKQKFTKPEKKAAERPMPQADKMPARGCELETV